MQIHGYSRSLIYYEGHYEGRALVLRKVCGRSGLGFVQPQLKEDPMETAWKR